MNRTIGQAFLLGLVAAFAMRLGPDTRPLTTANGCGAAPVREQTTGGIDAHTALASIRGKDPERLIEEFYSAEFNPSSPGFFDALAAAVSRAAGISPPSPSPPTLAEVGSLRAAADEHGIRVRFLILSVPDPIDSNLGYFSDITLDGLQRAAERRGYVFDRYWLPWAPARDGPGVSPGVLTKTADHAPGLILFRCSGNASDVLAVFVVGETPTTGVDKVALRRSLDFLSFWQATPRAPVSAGPEPSAPPDPLSKTSLRLHLVAPFFSGAASSIRLAIGEWFKEWSGGDSAEAPVAISCVSGSASAISNKSVLEFRELSANRPGLSVTFHATVIPDSVIREVLLDHLWQHGIEPHQVAFLTEADTSFGEQLLLPVAKPRQGAGKKASQTLTSPQGDVLQVPFPMHISSMRSAYDKDSRLLTGKRRDVDNAPKSNLDLSLGDTRGTPQHVPSFSPTTISSVERSIAHILLSMTRRGIRCIGLIATDVRDQLFLAEQVRFYCPEVQLVLFRADSIFTHPDVGPALEGSLIATTYPLISKNQKWTALDPRSASRRISFTNVASEGVYNATLALLAQSDLPVPGGSESSRCSDDQPRAANGPASRVAFEPLEYRTPFEDIGDGYHVAPPVWLTAVSNGEFWPIAVVPREKWQPLEQQQLPKNGDDKTIRDTPGNAQDASENDRHYVLRAVSEKKPHHSYRDSSATYGDPDIEDGLRGMLGLIATGFSGFCVVSSLRYLAGHIVATAGGDDAFRHYWWPVPYFLSLLAAEIALASPTLVHLSLWLRGRVSFCFGTDNWRRQAVILAVLATEHAALGAVFAAVAVGTVLAMRRPRIRQDCARVPAVVMRTVSWSFIAAAAVEAVVLYLVSNPSKPLSDAAIFLERSARFGDRVTPTLPCFFVAIAIAWWFRGHLQRRSFADRFPLLNPFERAPQQPRDLNYAGLTQIIRPLVGCLESGRGWPSRNDAEDFTWRAVLGHGFASVSRVLAWHTLIIFPFLFLVVAWAHSLAAYESAQFNTVVWLTWLAVVGLFWLTIWQFLWGSYVFLELLRRLARHPMADAFQRLPRKTRKALAWLLLSRLPRRFELEASLRIWQSLQCAVPGLAENSNNTSLRTHLDGLQLAAHYNYPSGDGSGQTVGLLEFGGGYFPDDLKKFCSLAGISPPTVTAISTDGTSTSAKDGAEGEVMLDIEVVAGVCPEANIAVYFAQWTEIGWITALDAAIQDSHNDPGVLSISWGAPEDTDIWTEQAMTQVNESFLEAAHLGITVCLAAGDDGSSDADLDGHAHVDFPGSSPYVLSVGGTTVLADDGSAPDVAWKEGDGLRNDNGGSTGGGVSAVFPRPAWQAGLDNIISVNPGAILGRCIPDLSANADWTASPYLLVVDGHAQPNGGTSAASPLVAALITRINGQRGPGKRLGYVTPVLYQKLGAQAVGALGCTDVESGDNNTSQVGGYSAGPGYDAASGWGTPNGQNLLHVLNMALLNGPAGAPAGAGAGAGGSAAG